MAVADATVSVKRVRGRAFLAVLWLVLTAFAVASFEPGDRSDVFQVVIYGLNVLVSSWMAYRGWRRLKRQKDGEP